MGRAEERRARQRGGRRAVDSKQQATAQTAQNRAGKLFGFRARDLDRMVIDRDFPKSEQPIKSRGIKRTDDLAAQVQQVYSLINRVIEVQGAKGCPDAQVFPFTYGISRWRRPKAAVGWVLANSFFSVPMDPRNDGYSALIEHNLNPYAEQKVVLLTTGKLVLITLGTAEPVSKDLDITWKEGTGGRRYDIERILKKMRELAEEEE